jgi:hypothetical protein
VFVVLVNLDVALVAGCKSVTVKRSHRPMIPGLGIDRGAFVFLAKLRD